MDHAATESSIVVTPPRVLTKELRLQRNAASGERWLRLSSNFLDAFGFSPGARIDRQIIAPGQGMRFTVAHGGSSRVYQRRYQRRRNNPFETQIDVKAQRAIEDAFPAYTDRVHFTLSSGEILARPVAERAFGIRKRHRVSPSPLETFVALSSGVDAAGLQSLGFSLQALFEYRPQERRDRQDLTETGILTASANCRFRFIFNEDIFVTDWHRVSTLLHGQPPISLLVASPTCDDFSALKARSVRDRHAANLESTRDMVYDVLRMVEVVEPAVVMIEQVPGFGAAAEGRLLETKLRRWGYEVDSAILDPREFGGGLSSLITPHLEPYLRLPRHSRSPTAWSTTIKLPH